MTAALLRSPRPYLGGALIAAGAFGLLAWLVAAGHLHRIDNFAVHHLMPRRNLQESRTSLLGSLLSYHGHHFHAAQVVKLPASALVATVILASICLLLWQRGRWDSAVLWACAFVAGSAIEIMCKKALTKPPLYVTTVDDRIHVAGFDDSFPSGHALRGAMLVAVLSVAWPSLRPFLLAWLAALVLILELYGIHTPSDIVGGLLLAAALILIVLPLTRKSRAVESTSQPASHAEATGSASLSG